MKKLTTVPNLSAHGLALLIATTICAAQVRVGADLLLRKNLSLVEGKRIGIVTNHSAVLSDGRHLVDALNSLKGVRITALFGPEHGIRGDTPDGIAVSNTIDSATGAKVFSLFGRTTKPTPEMLADVDVLLYDIQDVGVRFYTFETTLALTMEAAAERGIPYVVLDRPNPVGGNRVEGFVRLDSLRSFVGWNPTPIAHGMTVGELAGMINGEGWMAHGIRANLTVVRLEGWSRTTWFDGTGLPWVKPSPNMPTVKTAVVYPGICLVEGTNVSEGRGTERPFENVGAPYISGPELASRLNEFRLPGIVWETTEFTPEEIPRVASNPKYRGVQCGGVFLHVTDRDAFSPVSAGVHLLSAIRSMYPGGFAWRPTAIDRLAGTSFLRRAIDHGVPPDSIVRSWDAEVRRFESLRAKYLLYATPEGR